jgi:hypothetical protein
MSDYPTEWAEELDREVYPLVHYRLAYPIKQELTKDGRVAVRLERVPDTLLRQQARMVLR